MQQICIVSRNETAEVTTTLKDRFVKLLLKLGIEEIKTIYLVFLVYKSNIFIFILNNPQRLNQSHLAVTYKLTSDAAVVQ